MLSNKLLIVQKSKHFNIITSKDAVCCLNLIHVIENSAKTAICIHLGLKFYSWFHLDHVQLLF